jgi:hypothetical protein
MLRLMTFVTKTSKTLHVSYMEYFFVYTLMKPFIHMNCDPLLKIIQIFVFMVSIHVSIK